MEDRLHLIEQTVTRIEQGTSGSSELDVLRSSLIEIILQLERNPGIRTAADDLYEIAATLTLQQCSPTQRQQRVLRDAVHRFHERVKTSAPRTP